MGRDSQLGQVDPPGRELLEDRDQAARLVGPLEDDDRGLVVAGRRGDAVAGDERRSGSGCRGGPRCRRRGRRGRRARRRPRGAMAAVRRVVVPRRRAGPPRRCELAAAARPPAARAAQERVALGRGHRDRQHDLDVGERRARQGQQAVLDVEHDLALDEQVVVEGQRRPG